MCGHQIRAGQFTWRADTEDGGECVLSSRSLLRPPFPLGLSLQSWSRAWICPEVRPPRGPRILPMSCVISGKPLPSLCLVCKPGAVVPFPRWGVHNGGAGPWPAGLQGSGKSGRFLSPPPPTDLSVPGSSGPLQSSMEKSHGPPTACEGQRLWEPPRWGPPPGRGGVGSLTFCNRALRGEAILPPGDV